MRLIKFLHQRMGFDVLAWESGLYDVQLTQAAMRSGGDPVAAAQAGILLVWSATEEVRPLFAYVKASQSTARPLDLVGFDMQMNAVEASAHLAADLRSLAGALRDPLLRQRASELMERVIAAHEHLFARSELMRQIELDSVRAQASGKALAPPPNERVTAWEGSPAAKLAGRSEDLEALEQATDGLLAMLRAQRGAFLQVRSGRQIGFLERVLKNLRGNDRNSYDNERPDRPGETAASTLLNEDWNRRDALNAANLRWLIEEGYPNRRIIVWAHNAHLMNAYYAANVKHVHVEPQTGGREPTGVAMRKWLGDAVYTIGMTAYDGEDGWGAAKPVAPAPEGTLEWRLHQLHKPYVFLDLRALAASPEHRLLGPQSLRIDQYREDSLSDVTRPFDAIFFIDHMAPAVPIRAAHP